MYLRIDPGYCISRRIHLTIRLRYSIPHTCAVEYSIANVSRMYRECIPRFRRIRSGYITIHARYSCAIQLSLAHTPGYTHPAGYKHATRCDMHDTCTIHTVASHENRTITGFSLRVSAPELRSALQSVRLNPYMIYSISAGRFLIILLFT